MEFIKKLFNKNEKSLPEGFIDRRNNNPELDAHAIARGLKRRRDDKINDMFYSILITILVVVLGFFSVGSLFV